MKHHERVVFWGVVVSLALAACGKDPVPNETAFTIDTDAMYEELGITQDVKARLASGNYVLMDSLLVYDVQGSLVSRQGIESKQLGPVPVTVPELDNGTYSFVVFQTCRESGGKPGWDTFNAHQLSSLLIKQTENGMDYIGALGTACETVTVKDGIMQFSFAPQAAGCILEGRLDGYTRQNYFPGLGQDLPKIKLSGKRMLIGLYPGRQDDSRWVFSSLSQETIGYLGEENPQRKFFVLANDNLMTVSLQATNFLNYTYYEDSVTPTRGGTYVCYYEFASNSFCNSYLGAAKDLDNFLAEKAMKFCALDPYLEWGTPYSSAEEINAYVASRPYFPCGPGLSGSYRTLGGLVGKALKYELMPGLEEYYYFDSEDLLIEVEYEYDGTVPIRQVKSGLQALGYQYLGWFPLYDYSVVSVHLSPSGKTQCMVFPTSDVVYTIGVVPWAVVYQPYDPNSFEI